MKKKRVQLQININNYIIKGKKLRHLILGRENRGGGGAVEVVKQLVHSLPHGIDVLRTGKRFYNKITCNHKII